MSPLTDDRGARVRAFTPSAMSEWPLQTDARAQLVVQRVQAAMAASRRLDWALWVVHSVALGGTVILVYMIARALPTLSRDWIRWVLLVLIVLVIAIGGMLMERLRARRNARAIATVLLDEGLCPGCGYNLFGLVPEHDACVKCPECGAAWRADRLRRVQPFVAGPGAGMLAASVAHGGRTWTALDHTGARVPLLRARIWHTVRLAVDDDHRGRLRGARRRIVRTGWWIRWPIAMIPFGLAAFMAYHAWSFAATRGAFPLKIVGWVVFFAALGFAALFGNLGSRRSVVIREMLAQGLCPSCGQPIHAIPPGADGNRVCAGCHAAWRLPGDG